MFCLNLMRIALELAKENPAYEGLATKFFQHYIYVGAAMTNMGGKQYELWDEEDGFFYDILRFPDDRCERFHVRSLVGLIPMYAVELLRDDAIEPFGEFRESLNWFLRNKRHIVRNLCLPLDDRRSQRLRAGGRRSGPTAADAAAHVWIREEFLSPWGLRSLSKYHEAHPFCFADQSVRYEPGEADVKIMGGTRTGAGRSGSRRRYLLIESLRNVGRGARRRGDGAGARQWRAAGHVGADGRGAGNRLIGIFTRDAAGRRPVHGDRTKFQEDPHWRDLILFHEYFHAETGEGLGASHQTGWTGLVATLIDEWRR